MINNNKKFLIIPLLMSDKFSIFINKHAIYFDENEYLLMEIKCVEL